MGTKKPSKTDLLSRVPLFSQCTSRELSRIAALADEVDVPEGKVLTQEGKVGREFFVIASGRAKVTRGRKKVTELGPGEFFGEMSLLDHSPRSATVTAISDLELYVLDGRSFATLLEDAPSVAKKIMRGIAERLRRAEKAPTH
jgi:CRP-like cAMP-binding protein